MTYSQDFVDARNNCIAACKISVAACEKHLDIMRDSNEKSACESTKNSCIAEVQAGASAVKELKKACGQELTRHATYEGQEGIRSIMEECDKLISAGDRCVQDCKDNSCQEFYTPAIEACTEFISAANNCIIACS